MAYTLSEQNEKLDALIKKSGKSYSIVWDNSDYVYSIEDLAYDLSIFLTLSQSRLFSLIAVVIEKYIDVKNIKNYDKGGALTELQNNHAHYVVQEVLYVIKRLNEIEYLSVIDNAIDDTVKCIYG
jgi:hypothetical protein